MTMEQGFSRIKEIAEKMKEDRESGLAPSSATPSVREFMSWFGYARRGIWAVERVREELEANGLHVEYVVDEVNYTSWWDGSNGGSARIPPEDLEVFLDRIGQARALGIRFLETEWFDNDEQARFEVSGISWALARRSPAEAAVNCIAMNSACRPAHQVL